MCPQKSGNPRWLAMRISLLASVAMLIGKWTAYSVTHSAAFLSDAAESAVHGVATALAAFSLWYASRPPDGPRRDADSNGSRCGHRRGGFHPRPVW